MNVQTQQRSPDSNVHSKIGVKFEDGVAPGEGTDGERIMSPGKRALAVEVNKKDRNMIERTIWTFIMIGGFIGERCASPAALLTQGS